MDIRIVWSGLDDVAGAEEAVVFGVREKTKTMADFMESSAGEIVIEFGNFSINICVPERIGVKAGRYRLCLGRDLSSLTYLRLQMGTRDLGRVRHQMRCNNHRGEQNRGRR